MARTILNKTTIQADVLDQGFSAKKEEIVTILRDVHSTTADGEDDMDYWFAYKVYPEAKFVLNELITSNQITTEDGKEMLLETYKTRVTVVFGEEYALDDDY